MINFILKKESNNSPHYNLTLMKLVHKRGGEIVEEPGETIYGNTLDVIKNYLAHLETEQIFGDKDVSLREYLIEFYKSYKKVCESLKKIL